MVEFALVALPFFLLLFGTLELGFIIWASYELENATEDAARTVRTGQVQTSNGATAEDFKQLLCSRVTFLADCLTKIRVDVRSYPNFAAMQGNGPAPLDENGELEDSFEWNTGEPREIVLVTSFYQWPLFTGITSAALSNMAGGDRLLRASAAFRNEAFIKAGGGI